MARKFKIGDKVKVVKCVDEKNYPLDDDFKVGHRGVVVGYLLCNKPHYYGVKRKNKNLQYFNVKELKLIKRKGD